MQQQNPLNYPPPPSNQMFNPHLPPFNVPPPPPPNMFPGLLGASPHMAPQSPQQGQLSFKPVPLMSINPFANTSPPHNNQQQSYQQQQQPPPPPPPPMQNFGPQQMFSFNLNQPPPGFNPNSPMQPQMNQNLMQQHPFMPIPDLSKPPPGFASLPPLIPQHPLPLMHHEIQHPTKPLMSLQEKKLAEIPYFSLPAALMVPLIKVSLFKKKLLIFF